MFALLSLLSMLLADGIFYYFEKIESVISTPLIILLWLIYMFSVAIAKLLSEKFGGEMFVAGILGGMFLRMALGLIYVIGVIILLKLDVLYFVIILMAKYVLLLVYEVVFVLKDMGIKIELTRML